MEKVKYFQEFYKIQNGFANIPNPLPRGFGRTLLPLLKAKLIGCFFECEFFYIQKFYVFSINQRYDGVESFDISSINYSDEESLEELRRFGSVRVTTDYNEIDDVNNKNLGTYVPFSTIENAKQALQTRFSRKQLDAFAKCEKYSKYHIGKGSIFV